MIEAFDHTWAIVLMTVALGVGSLAAILWVAVCEG